MFNSIGDNDEDRARLDAVNVCMFLGWVPFVIAYGNYNTVFTEWLSQVYFITFMVFINYPRWYEKRNLRKSWFWRAMLLMALVPHPAILAGMWVVDAATKTKWRAGATVLCICAAAGVLDMVAVNKVFDYFRPADESSEASGGWRSL